MDDENQKDAGEVEIYELGYHLLPLVSEESLAEELSKIHAAVSKNEGVVIAESTPQMRQLAYSITKKIDAKNIEFNKSYFGWVKFEMNRELAVSFKKNIESNPNILRFIIIKTVRENTMHTPKIPTFRPEVKKEEVVGETVAEKPVSQEEIDKSIDELLVNEI